MPKFYNWWNFVSFLYLLNVNLAVVYYLTYKLQYCSSDVSKKSATIEIANQKVYVYLREGQTFHVKNRKQI